MEPTKAYEALSARELRDEAQYYRAEANTPYAWLPAALAQACAEALEYEADKRASAAQSKPKPTALRIVR